MEFSDISVKPLDAARIISQNLFVFCKCLAIIAIIAVSSPSLTEFPFSSCRGASKWSSVFLIAVQSSTQLPLLYLYLQLYFYICICSFIILLIIVRVNMHWYILSNKKKCWLHLCLWISVPINDNHIVGAYFQNCLHKNALKWWQRKMI